MSTSKAILLGFWLASVVAVSYLLAFEEHFFASSGVPIAAIRRANNDVTYRSEDDTRWKTVGADRQSIFDGDRLATGPSSTAVIDFGDGRAANVGEETAVSISTIRQASGLTYIISLAKGAVAIEKIKSRSKPTATQKFPIIVRSGGRDFQIEPEEEKSIVKDDKGVSVVKGKPSPVKKKVEKKEVILAEMPAMILEKIPVVEPIPTSIATTEVVALAPPPPSTPVPPPVQKPKKKLGPAKVTDARKSSELPEPPVVGTEIKLDTSALGSEHFTFQSLQALKGDLGMISWESPASPPEGWQGVIEITNGNSRNIIDGLSGAQKKFRLEDLGMLTSQSVLDGIPCATVGFRGGSKILAGTTPKYSFLGEPSRIRICSFKDAERQLPLTVGISSLEGDAGQRGTLFSRPGNADLKYQMIITNSSDYVSVLPLLQKSANIRIARSNGLAPSGVFIARSGKVIMQLTGRGFNASAADKILSVVGGDFVFKGERSALYDATAMSTEQLKDWVGNNASKGKKVYVHKDGLLVPVSRDFLEERREVAAFIKAVASQVLTEKVDIIAFR